MRIRSRSRVAFGAAILLVSCATSQGQQAATAKESKTIPSGPAAIAARLNTPPSDIRAEQHIFRDGNNGTVVGAEHRNMLRKLGHYAITHKELFAADALVVFALSADSASSIHCQNASTGCYEISPILGAHPNQMQYWGSTFGMSAGIIAANQLLWRHSHDGLRKHGIWMFSMPAIAAGAIDTRNSVNAAESLQQYQLRRASAQLIRSAPIP
jgi:hypothetical protein